MRRENWEGLGRLRLGVCCLAFFSPLWAIGKYLQVGDTQHGIKSKCGTGPGLEAAAWVWRGSSGKAPHSLMDFIDV